MGCKPVHEARKITDLKDLLNQSAELFGGKPAFRLKAEVKGEFKLITYRELKENVDALGTALVNMGLKDEMIVVIGENRYEWAISYLSVVTRNRCRSSS